MFETLLLFPALARKVIIGWALSLIIGAMVILIGHNLGFDQWPEFDAHPVQAVTLLLLGDILVFVLISILLLFITKFVHKRITTTDDAGPRVAFWMTGIVMMIATLLYLALTVNDGSALSNFIILYIIGFLLRYYFTALAIARGFWEVLFETPKMPQTEEVT